MTIRETDYMSELAAATRMRPTRASALMLYSIVGLIVLFFVWAGFSRVDMLVRGPGLVVPSGEIQIVQSLEGGILQELLVKQGERVAKDQILMRLSDVMFSSEQGGAEAQILTLRAKKARLEAESKGVALALPPEIAEKAPKIAANEQALYESRQRELENALSITRDKIARAQSQIAETKAQISRLSSSAGLLNQELTITRNMVAQKAVPKLEQIRLERELNDTQGQLNASRQKLPGVEAELSAAEKELTDQRDRFRSQALSEMNAVETDISRLGQSLKSIGDRVSRAEIRSPVDGIVNNISIRTIGGVIEPAQQLVEIVPVEQELKIVARVLPSDIAFLELDQPVKIKITAYDSQRYGMLSGKLVRIGANSIADDKGNSFFEVEVKTDRSYLGSDENPLPITTGMEASIEIVTGRRTILEYLAKPVLQARDKAFTEI